MACNCNHCIRYIHSALYTGVFQIHKHLDGNIKKLREFLESSQFERKAWKTGTLTIRLPESKDKKFDITNPIDVDKLIKIIIDNATFTTDEIAIVELNMNKITTPYNTKWKKSTGIRKSDFKQLVSKIVNYSIDNEEKYTSEMMVVYNESSFERFVNICEVYEYIGLELEDHIKQTISGDFTKPFHTFLNFKLEKSKFVD